MLMQTQELMQPRLARGIWSIYLELVTKKKVIKEKESFRR
jgi:hypothetical protein